MPDLVPVDYDPFNPVVLPVEHDPFADQPLPKAGQTIQPQNIMGGISSLRSNIASGVANVTGLADAAKALRGEQTPDEAQMFALGALPALIGGPEAKAAEEAVPLASKAIRAFHGSPYDFNAFDMSKIGTGEGAQAYGHGLYLAENPATAQQYKDALGRKGIEWATPDAASKYDPFTLEAIKREFQKGQTKDDIMKMNAQYAREADSSGQPNLMGDMHNALASGDVSAGKMYEVNINADPDHFLDWDKPLSEQHPVVQGAAQNLGIDSFVKQWPGEESAPSGQAIYNYLRSNRGTVTAAEKLRDAGIPGIKYLDQGSRNQGAYSVATKMGENGPQYSVSGPGNISHGEFNSQQEARAFADQKNKEGQTSNYVVFNDKLIDIIKKYGMAGLVAGGAAHFSTQPVEHDPFQ